MNVIDYLVKSLRDAAIYNPDVQVAPACILWPDGDRQWEPILPRLKLEIPELFTLGDYDPGDRTGPAIWLRCILARAIDDYPLPAETTPIFYLPGVKRQDLRAVETCPDLLKPLAELQYRGVFWSQLNAKDWTIFAFLKSDQGGLGLDVARDNDTKSALKLALYRFLDEELEPIQGKRLDQDYFNTLLTGGDPTRDLLLWLDQGDAFQNTRHPNEWQGFISLCQSKFDFDPENDGALHGAGKLAEHTGPWNVAWERFCEAPKRYPHLPNLLRQCHPPNDTLFWESSDGNFPGWPQWNDHQEQKLRQELMALGENTAPNARQALLELDAQHASRRHLVWVELGESPLALALGHLAILAIRTQTSLAAGGIDDLAQGYQTYGWEADNAVLEALAVVDKTPDIEAVTTAIRAVYLPWAEESARYLQKTVAEGSYPRGTILDQKFPTYEAGECVLFVDGLRFDVAKRLQTRLSEAFEVTTAIAWAALPSVTATGKAAVSPLQPDLCGEDDVSDFEPCLADTGQSLKGGYHFKKRLKERNWQRLERSNLGDGQGNAWYEFGDIDHEGHDRGWKLAKHIDTLLTEIQEQITLLIQVGWQKIRIVTDHGWLLLPGGLPKTELPSVLTETKWGRCAVIKPGATTDQRLFPWFWNPHQYFAFADGISCFRRGDDYVHGGLSLQECLCLELAVTRRLEQNANPSVEITDIVWKGLRCTIAVAGDIAGLSLDIRTHPGNSASSVVLSVKEFKANGTASVVVENEDLEGQSAYLILLDANNQVIAQYPVEIGKTNP
ncbi:MAG: BREX-1 system phosphatase PglZ type B [Snowella sp.]|nr:BREX-1 system phosphatase PglZ type B [Snowella sp.]